MRRVPPGILILALLCLAANLWATPLHEAAKAGRVSAVKRLLAEDPSLLTAPDEDGYTPLHWAAIRAHWSTLQTLLAAGAAVDAVGVDGGTPLHWACHHDNAPMVQLLLDHWQETSRPF